jgi:hypothetical protein
MDDVEKVLLKQQTLVVAFIEKVGGLGLNLMKRRCAGTQPGP